MIIIKKGFTCHFYFLSSIESKLVPKMSETVDTLSNYWSINYSS